MGISFALEAATIATFPLRWNTRLPDFLGYASSLTMENWHCEREGLAESSALDALERARRMGENRFRTADVREGMEVGHLALVPVGGMGDRRGREKRKRKSEGPTGLKRGDCMTDGQAVCTT